MGVQISRGVYSEVSKKDVVRGVASAPGRGVPQFGQAKRMHDPRRSNDARSCAHVDIDPTETCSVTGRRIYQRQECDTHGSGVRGQEAQLRRSALLGQRLLCINGWAE